MLFCRSKRRRVTPSGDNLENNGTGKHILTCHFLFGDIYHSLCVKMDFTNHFIRWVIFLKTIAIKSAQICRAIDHKKWWNLWKKVSSRSTNICFLFLKGQFFRNRGLLSQRKWWILVKGETIWLAYAQRLYSWWLGFPKTLLRLHSHVLAH